MTTTTIRKARVTLRALNNESTVALDTVERIGTDVAGIFRSFGVDVTVHPEYVSDGVFAFGCGGLWFKSQRSSAALTLARTFAAPGTKLQVALALRTYGEELFATLAGGR